MIAVKRNTNMENVKNLYTIGGWFFYPTSGNDRVHQPFSGHFTHSPYLDNILEGEMLDKFGVSYFSGVMNLKGKTLTFTKHYGGAKGNVIYGFKKDGPLWKGEYRLEGNSVKDDAICKISPLLKGDVRPLNLSHFANEIYRELLRKASKSR